MDLACGATAGIWYVRVENTEPVAGNDATVTITPNIVALPSVVTFLANNQTQTFTVTPPADPNSKFSKFDLYTYKVPVATSGARFTVEAIVPPGESVTLYFNRKSVAFPVDLFNDGVLNDNCQTARTATGVGKFTFDPCTFSQMSNEDWFLTLERQPSLTQYALNAYIERPTILNLASGALSNGVGRLNKVDDILYFRFPLVHTPPATFVAVVENIDGGVVDFSLQKTNLPFNVDCSPPVCTTAVSCHLTVYPCELTNGDWFLAVKAKSLDDTNTPITFTVTARVDPVTAIDLAYNIPYPSNVRRTQYRQFRVPVPTTPGDWLHVHAYLDSTFFVTADAILYVHTLPNPGDGNCFDYTYTCNLVENQDDRKSCSIQLDPCQLKDFTGFVYISMYASPNSNDFYWTQEQLGFTLVVTKPNANFQPRLLLAPQNLQIQVVSDVVAETQTNLYRVDYFGGDLIVALSAADDEQSQTESEAVTLSLYYGVQFSGPSCPCWTAEKTVVIKSSRTEALIRTACEHPGEPVFIGVTGDLTLTNPNDPLNPGNEAYHYVENQYILTVRRQLSPALSVTPLGPDTIVYSQLTGTNALYRLVFDRSALLSKSIQVKTRSHAKARLFVGLEYFDGKLENQKCQTSSIIYCNSSNSNDGYCTVTYNCLFIADNDNREFLISISADGTWDSNLGTDIYSVEYNLISNVAKPLTSGVSVANYLQRNIYQHYTITVDATQAKRKNLLIEVYFDAGYQVYDNQEIFLYINDPSNPRLAGEPTFKHEGNGVLIDSCLCRKIAKSDRRKVVYFINSCNLAAGTYYLSVVTREPVYDTFPAKYTITATLQEPILNNIQFDVPFSYSYYQGQVFSFPLDLPATMFNTVDQDKSMKIKVIGTDVEDEVLVYFSQIPPQDTSTTTSTCACYKTEYFCRVNSSTPSCEIGPLDYCTLDNVKKNYRWYLTPFISKSKNPNDPVSFSTAVTKKNAHAEAPINILAQATCTPDQSLIVSSGVIHKNYRHFTISNVGVPANSKIELHFQNVQNGQIVVSLNQGNLATQGCKVTGTVCSSGVPCVIEISCGNVPNYLSVYGIANSISDPVTFEVFQCYSSLSAVTVSAAAIAGEVVPAGNTKTYVVSSMNLITASKLHYLIVKFDNPQPAGNNLNVKLIPGKCSTCSSAAPIVITGCPAACSPVYFCQLPADYATVSWFLDVENPSGNQFTSDFHIVLESIESSLPDLPIHISTPVSVPAPAAGSVEGWTFVRFTLRQQDLFAIGTGLQNLEIDIETTGGSLLSSWLNIGAVQPVSVPQPPCYTQRFLAPLAAKQTYSWGATCCQSPSAFTLSFQNTDPNGPGTVTVTPRLVNQSYHTPQTWNFQTSSTWFQSVVSVNSNGESQLRDHLLPYPGPSDQYGSLLLTIETQDPSGTWYLKRNAFAGPNGACYSNDDSATISAGTKSTRQYYSCGVGAKILTADDYWFGFESGGGADSSMTFTVTAKNTVPTYAAWNKNYTWVVNQDEYHQFVFDVPNQAQLKRTLEFRATSNDNAFRFYISTAGPAGNPNDDNRPLAVRCLSNSGSRDVAALGNDVYSFVTCDEGLPKRYFVGIQGNGGSVNSSVTVIAFFKDPEPAPEVLPLLAQSISSTATTYSYTTASNVLSSGLPTYLRVLATKMNPAGNKFSVFNPNTPDSTSKWTSAGNCNYLDTLYQDPDLSADTASVIVYPCLLTPNTEYRFDFAASGSVTADLNATIHTFNPIPIIIPAGSETKGVDHRGVVFPHELAIYTVKLDSTFLRAGQSASINLQSVSCGKVEVWINKGSPAGKYCNIQNQVPCNDAGCNLATISACREDDWVETYFITVRGLIQTKDQPVLPIKFTISVVPNKDAPLFKPMHTNEKHTLYAYVPQGVAGGATCAALTAPSSFTPCCPAIVPIGPKNYIPELVHFYYPIEGAHFLENHNEVTLELITSYASFGRLHIDISHPRFCPSGTTYNCTVDVINPKCTIAIEKCNMIQGARHVYIWAELTLLGNITVDPSRLTSTGGKLGVAYIHNLRNHYSITSVDYSTTTKYLQYALSAGQTQYIKVNHESGASLANIPNYYFSATTVKVSNTNSRVSLRDSWYCWPQICQDNANCEGPLPGVTGTLCQPLQACTCHKDVLPCSIDKNVNSQTFMSLTNSGTALTVGRMEMKFLRPEERITAQSCDILPPFSERYYQQTVAVPPTTPSAKQLWWFNLAYYQDFEAAVQSAIPGTGNVVLNIYEGGIAVNHVDSGLPTSCAKTPEAICTAQDTTGCTRYWRREDVPHVSVSTLAITQQHYQLNAQLIDVNVQVLTDGVTFFSPTKVTGCAPAQRNQFYSYVSAIAGNYLLVELTGTATVWMYRNHVTYRYSLPGDSCTAAGYCYFIVGCNHNVADTYYFMVDQTVNPNILNAQPDHSITVTRLNVNPINLPLGQSVSVNLIPKRVVSYQINLNNLNDDTPRKDLFINYGVTTATADIWITRTKFGDARCAITPAHVNNNNPPAIPACDQHKPSDVFLVNFFSTGSAPACSKASFTLNAFFGNSDQYSVVTSTTNTILNAGITSKSRFAFNIGAVTQADVIYVKLYNIRNGELTHDIWKANHINAVGGYPLPCSGCNKGPQYPYVSWHDDCWHCSSYDKVYVDVTPTKVGTSLPNVQFSIDVFKRQWTPLTAQWNQVVFDNNLGSVGIEGQLAFFGASLDQTLSQRIELEVLSGQTVKVEIFGAPCPHAPTITVYCYPGMVCTLPFPFEGNFGAFQYDISPFSPSSLSFNSLRIVVSGQSATFRVRQLSGTGTCNPISNGFCGATDVLRGQFIWGDLNTFDAKHLRAQDRYHELVEKFRCPQTCACVDLSQECLNNLKRYACDESLQSCSDAGFALRPAAKLCSDVEATCKNSFQNAGFPELACFHSFYLSSAAKWTLADGSSVLPPASDSSARIGGVLATTSLAGVPAPTGIDSTTGGAIVPTTPVPFPADTTAGPASSAGSTDSSAVGSTDASTVGSTDASTQGTTASTVGTTVSTVGSTTQTTAGNPNSTLSTTGGATTAGNTLIGTVDGGSGVVEESTGLSAGAIAGIVIGVIILLVIIAGLVYFFVIKGGSDGGVYKNFDQK